MQKNCWRQCPAVKGAVSDAFSQRTSSPQRMKTFP